MRPVINFATVAVLALVLSACGGTGGSVTTSGGARMMAPVSIEQVLTFDADTPVFVKGTLYSDANGVRLCEAIGESAPVSCLGDQITILDLDAFPEYADLLVGDGEVRTSNGEVDLVGFYSNGSLRIDPAAANADAS